MFCERDPARHAWATQRLLTTDPEGRVGACATLAAQIPGCRLEILDGAGHIANLEAAEAFSELLVGFLSS